MNPINWLALTTLLMIQLLPVGTLSLIEKSSLSNEIPVLQVSRDEFNSTEKPDVGLKYAEELVNGQSSTIRSLSLILQRQNLTECCLPWKNLTSNPEIQDEMRRRFGKSHTIFKPIDLLNEIKQTYLNVTYLAIDGQPGENEWDKYYSFYDGVQYLLKLLKVAREFMSQNDDSINNSADTQSGDTFKMLKRQAKRVEFKINQDPQLSSFINELTNSASNGVNGLNENFEFYEDFIRFTQFGRYYAQNISMIRESVAVFNQICSHLRTLNLQSNLTRPSKAYEMNRRMSLELYLIKNELRQQISPRVLVNRQDVRNAFKELDNLTNSRPYIRLLGDEFSSSPAHFSTNVRQLTHLLDLYTTNSLTSVSFYDQLSQLPEEFITLGVTIARDYETREVPTLSRFDSEYFDYEDDLFTDKKSNLTINDGNLKDEIDARQTNQSILTRIFT